MFCLKGLGRGCLFRCHETPGFKGLLNPSVFIMDPALLRELPPFVLELVSGLFKVQDFLFRAYRVYCLGHFVLRVSSV